MIIKKDRLFILSTGEYSDYGVQSMFRAKVDLNAQELSNEYLKLYPDQGKAFYAEFSQFIHWLTNVKDVIEEMDYLEWHIGSYAEIDPEVRTTRGYYITGVVAE